MRATGWLIVVVLGLAPTAHAQPRRGSDAVTPERPAGGAPLANAERRERIKKRLRAMRAYTLTEELALDEPTAGKLFPVLARYDDETDKLLQTRVDIQRRLRRADTMRDARALERLIDEAIANQHGFWELEDRRLGDLRKILTPAQIAKLLVVMPALERKIQNQLRRAIVQRRAGPGGAAPDAADDDLETDEVAPRSPASPHRREAPLAPRSPSNAPGNPPPCDPNTQPCR